MRVASQSSPRSLCWRSLAHVSPALGLRWLGQLAPWRPRPEPAPAAYPNQRARLTPIKLRTSASTVSIWAVPCQRVCQGYEKHRDTVFGRPAPLRSSSLPRSCIGPPGGEAAADGRQEGRDAAADRRDAAGSSFRQGSRAVGQGGARRDSGRQARSREDEERDAWVSKKTGTRRCIASGAAPSIALT